jgi:glycosyltransferase involved in cell wall biosynthesis
MPWRILQQRPHQIALRLAAKGHKVLFVDSPVALAPSFFFALFREKEFFFTKRVFDNLTLCNIFLPPFMGRFSLLSRKIAQLTFKVFLKYLRFIPDIAILYSPTDVYLLETLNSGGAQVIYDCVDEFSAFSHVTDSFSLLRAERELAAKSAIVIASSRLLWCKFLELQFDCYYIPNGVEFSHFHKAVDAMGAPQDVEHLQHPIIGFIGNIQDWVDVDLICYLADSHPDFSILLVGPVNFAKEKLERHKNITLVGNKRYNLLPQYLSCMDVCLIPFKINELTLASNPIKMYEYLATGKPIVSTALPEVRTNAPGLIYIAKDSDDFIKKVELAVRESKSNTNELSLRRVAFAKANSWNERSNTFEKLLLMVKAENGEKHACIQTIK